MNWIADPLRFQDRYSQKYGDIFTMRLSGLGSFVIVGNPQAIQDIFSQDSKFDVGRGNALAEPLVGQNSLMLMDGARHRRERKLLMPPFHGERLQTYAKQICLITEQVASHWQVGQPFVARTAMQKVSLEVMRANSLWLERSLSRNAADVSSYSCDFSTGHQIARENCRIPV